LDTINNYRCSRKYGLFIRLNKIGFTALPDEKRNLEFPEIFVDIGNGGYGWIVTEIQNAGVSFYMYFNSPYPNLFYTNKEAGFSVRSIKD
jgi:hypothetical protein